MVQEGKRVTIVDIARMLGVSPKSVSFALNDTGRLSEELRQRVKETARTLGYRPNLAARRLVTRGSYLIGVLLPYTSASFTGRLLDGIESVTQQENIGLLLGNGGFALDGVERSIKQMQDYGVSGMIVMPYSSTWQIYAKHLSDVDYPVVQMMNPRMEIGRNYVEVNNMAASNEAVRYLLKLGHSKIGFIGVSTGDISLTQRTAGYKLAMDMAGIKINPAWMVDVPIDINTENLTREVERLLDRAPELTAIFCVSDELAIKTLRVLLKRGIKVPEEFSVMGFDGMDIATQQVFLPLTTMRQPQEQIGKIAGQMLLDMIAGENGSGISLNCDLQLGATTAPCRNP